MRKELLLFAFLVGIIATSCTSVETQVSERIHENATSFTKSSSLSPNVVEQSDFVVTEADIRSFVQRRYHVNWGWDGLQNGQNVESFATIPYNQYPEMLYNIHSNAN